MEPRHSSVEVRTTPNRRNPEDFQFIKFVVADGVARMTLNRPDHNLLNENMLREMSDGIAHAGELRDVKLIVLDSACKVFCGGIDVGEYTSQRVFQMLDAFHAVFAGILEISKPVMCVVNGPAIGGGAELAAFGDLVIATPRARFAQPEITIGVFPPLASTILPFLVETKVALELVLMGEPVTAERALELGMINRLVPRSSIGVHSQRHRRQNYRPLRPGSYYGQKGYSRRHGTFLARRPQKFHEYLPQRTLSPRRFTGRCSRSGRKTQANWKNR